MLNRFIFGNLLYFNRTILCILTVRAVQLCKIQRDFLRICTLYVELCRYFCADVARRRGTRFVWSCWKRKNAGAASPRGGAKGWLVCAEWLSGKRGGRLASERCSPLHALCGWVASPTPRGRLPICGRIWNAPLRCDGRLPYYIYIEKTPRPAAWCCGRGGSGAYLLQIRPIRLGRPRESAGI